MKKFIAILMVLAIVAGFAFAAETHTISVNGKVEEVLPIFQLKMQKDGNVKTNNTNGGAEWDATKSYTADGTAVDLEFYLDQAGTVVVIAQLANPAKTTKAFNLVFSDGVFSVKRNETSGTYAPTGITVVKGSDNVGFAISDITNGVQVDFDGKTSGVTYTDAQSVEHTGTVISAAAPHTLATATYAYPGDTTIDPNEVDGYEANIVLTISAV